MHRFRVFAVLSGVLLLTSFSQAQTATGETLMLDLPRASQHAQVMQRIGITDITVNYHRPLANGRQIWGKVVPYGQVWRAGANENTIITFSHAAKLEGKDVPAGEYGLFFVVNEDNTGEVVLSKDHRSWGSFFYEADNDLLRSKIQLRSIPMTELLTYDFINTTKTSAELVLNWEKKQFPVKIEFDVDRIVLNNAEEELKGPTGFNWQGFASAANYALQNKTGYEQALVWADQAVAQNKAFPTLSTKANLLRATGRTAEADTIMKQAIAIANENELNLYGYNLMNAGQHDKAIEIFILNTKRFPNSANTFDSLGEAYATKGDKKNAIASFKKSLSMNPPANVRANSEKFLKQLGAM